MENPILYVAISLMLTFVEVMSNTDNTADCPKIYQRFSTSHTYCQPKNTSCNIIRSNLAQQEINQVIQLHNNYRSTIATQGKGSNGLPPAADMLYMEWDNELAAIAQRHTDSCVYKHDEGDERRVRNFGVGQNIGKQTVSGSNVEQPQPDWAWAIGAFYNEIKDFSRDMNCGSRDLPPGHGEIGHFTQVVWSRSFRVGCGYTLFKEGDTYTRYYACNYGPGGNVGGECVYTEGPACSKCPANTQCTKDTTHPGLCQRTNTEAPYQPLKVPTIFNCNFINANSEDCKIHAIGDNSWYYTPALGGNYLETVLQPGQNGTVIFSKRIIGGPSAKKLCVQIKYRKGPELAKNAQNNVGKAIFIVPAYNDFTAPFDFPSYDGGFRQGFTPYSLTLGWKEPTELKISFAVPNGATPQFFNVKSIVGFNDKCENTGDY
ncbi:CRISP/Allergen/PR-1 isoform X2 [Parasteatoda tepidariorum]|nr:CRISP/Allergen/PR-1 [Parasteatoda tepidariorum]XP_042896962.1 CRISP/Allergen/PR-1 [Parasteatoda tepidariorum]XP_042896963.1 CRISP/Allergen/PR-1 [Parasteatoda tepidariorum]